MRDELRALVLETNDKWRSRDDGKEWTEMLVGALLSRYALVPLTDFEVVRTCEECRGNGCILIMYPRPGGVPGNQRRECEVCHGTGEIVTTPISIDVGKLVRALTYLGPTHLDGPEGRLRVKK